MKKILVTGGAGYVGSVLVDHLLNNKYTVTVVDRLMYENGHTMINYFKNPRFTFVKGDVRDEPLMKKLTGHCDCVIHLAAIVGFPACEKDQDLARTTNLEATKIISHLLSQNQPIIFASTGSNYGVVDGICTEETPLNPLSLYGKTKTDAEKWLLEHNTAVVYRFATAFGLSPRMRLDLLINDFVYEAAINKYLIMFEKHFKRTFIHVDDMARSFVFALENMQKMRGEVFNVGDSTNNFNKEDIALMIRKKIDYYLHFADIGEDKDKRNYEVCYAKINVLGYKASISVEEGIEQMLRAIPVLEHQSKYRNV